MLAAMWWTDKTISVRHLASMKRFPFPQSVSFAAFLSIFIYSGFAQSGASYTAQRRIDTIAVDGNLNEASWAGAASTAVFTLWNGNVAPVSLQTSAKIIWDDQYLFFGVTAKDPDVYATYAGRDRSLWEQDNFEVFMTVPGTTDYVKVENSPTGAI